MEAFAILVSLKLLFGNAADTEDKRVLIVPFVTDNRGNGAALNELMSTRFPSSAVLMELATYESEEVENDRGVGSGSGPAREWER